MKAMSSITSYLSVNCPKTALHMEYVKYFHASVSEFLALSRIWAPNGIIIEYCRDGFLRNIYVLVRIFRINVVLIYVNLCVTGHQHLIHVNFPWTYQLHPRSNIQFESIKHSIRNRTWWQRAFISIFRYQITKNLPPLTPKFKNDCDFCSSYAHICDNKCLTKYEFDVKHGKYILIF